MKLDLLLITSAGVTKLLTNMPAAPPVIRFPLVGCHKISTKWGTFRRIEEPIDHPVERDKLVLMYEEIAPK